MKQQNSTQNYFDSSVESLLNMRRFTHFCPTSLSMDNLNNDQTKIKNNFNDDIEYNYEYIRPSPSISIETINNNKYTFENKKNSSNRFSFLIPDIIHESKPNDNISTIKMKYELPNVQNIHSPVKTFKPIQVISFVKK